ncbi:uncharacterized protein BDZ99DRAFT_497486 [Mytilinidion resinicola]|uniref:Uncharacterized protein n=1 Tax=Mytilinidion resinicola TaxID=574789 RepID=A0A6A6YSE8_9PEZI|nr:uncharacterized protein BDZ99DRAFT_497486 [Mytilinidion resinicola]KAF2811852.1 hypothetical protein BDZ99DRAFT_497486 [Mytilinidion resinicola]
MANANVPGRQGSGIIATAVNVAPHLFAAAGGTAALVALSPFGKDVPEAPQLDLPDQIKSSKSVFDISTDNVLLDDSTFSPLSTSATIPNSSSTIPPLPYQPASFASTVDSGPTFSPISLCQTEYASHSVPETSHAISGPQISSLAVDHLSSILTSLNGQPDILKAFVFVAARRAAPSVLCSLPGLTGERAQTWIRRISSIAQQTLPYLVNNQQITLVESLFTLADQGRKIVTGWEDPLIVQLRSQLQDAKGQYHSLLLNSFAMDLRRRKEMRILLEQYRADTRIIVKNQKATFAKNDAQLRKELASQHDIVLKNIKESHKQELEELSSKMSEGVLKAQKETADIRAQLSKANAEASTNGQRAQKVESESRERGQQLLAALKELTGYRNHSKTLDLLLAESNKALSDAERRFSPENEKNKRLNSKMAFDIETLQARLDASEKRRADDKAESTSIVAGLREGQVDLQSDIQTRDDKLAKMAAELASLHEEQERHARKSDLKIKDKEIASLKDLLESKESDSTTSAETINHLESKLVGAEAEKEAVEKKLSDTSGEWKKRFEDQKAGHKSEVSRITSEYEKATSDLRLQVKQLKTENNSIPMLQRRIGELQPEILKLIDQNAALQKDSKFAGEALFDAKGKHNAELDVAKDWARQSQRQLEQMSKEYAKSLKEKMLAPSLDGLLYQATPFQKRYDELDAQYRKLFKLYQASLETIRRLSGNQDLQSSITNPGRIVEHSDPTTKEAVAKFSELMKQLNEMHDAELAGLLAEGVPERKRSLAIYTPKQAWSIGHSLNKSCLLLDQHFQEHLAPKDPANDVSKVIGCLGTLLAGAVEDIAYGHEELRLANSGLGRLSVSKWLAARDHLEKQKVEFLAYPSSIAEILRGNFERDANLKIKNAPTSLPDDDTLLSHFPSSTKAVRVAELCRALNIEAGSAECDDLVIRLKGIPQLEGRKKKKLVFSRKSEDGGEDGGEKAPET